jgi:hypothetical protein
MDTPQYLNEYEVIKITGLSIHTVRNWRYLHKGPAYVKAGKSVRYRLQDVVDYMESRKINPMN